jgi:magnesium transporter
MLATDLLPLHQLVFETAAEHVSTRVPIVARGDRVGQIRQALAGQRFDTAAEIAVVEDGKLLGLVGMEDLLAASDDLLPTELMDADPPVVAPGLDQEQVAWKAVQHGESCLAVVDASGSFLGLIPPRRLLSVLLWEHDEDIAHLGGFLRGTSEARSASEEPVARRLWHRLPWLLLGLAGAILSADLVGFFHGQLEKNVILAFFLPGVVYLADAVGTQTETLVIRGLSVGIPIARVLRREMITGMLVGATISLAFFPVAFFRWGRADVSFAVSLALLAACSTASLVAMTLPWLLHQLNRDPAFGSGPLGTVIQDLLSVLIYLVICVMIVR